MCTNSLAGASDLSEWAEVDYDALTRCAIITEEVMSNNLKEGITRAEVCGMLANFYERLTWIKIIKKENPFVDTNDEDVIRAYSVGIVSGRGGKYFDPYGVVTREEFCIMMVNLLNKAGKNCTVTREIIHEILNKYWDGNQVSSWAKEAVVANIHYGIMSGASPVYISPGSHTTREQAIIMINRAYNNFAVTKANYGMPIMTSVADDNSGGKVLSWSEVYGVQKYDVLIKNSMYELVNKFETTETSANIYEEPGDYQVVIGAEIDKNIEVFSMPNDVKVSGAIYEQQSGLMNSMALSEKEQRVFPGGVAFTSAEEAKGYMTEVTVPVWKLKSDGSKYSAKVSLTVNSALASDVVNIFTEIYNSPEQFPIKDVGGYYWRNTAGGRLSQHSYGTCIDINANENYYVETNGTPIVGSFWKPYENPYSIPEDGIVVRTFAKYGWEWGGNCWGDSYAKDYMHFTYLGK